MIKISQIKPIDKCSYSTISDLKKDYLFKFTHKKGNEILPIDLLRNFNKTGKLDKDYKLENPKQKKIIKLLIKDYKKIIVAEPNELESYTMKTWNDEIKNSENFRDALLYIFGYEERFRENVNRGIWLAKMLNIKSCPYCNAQYTILIQDHNKKSIAKFQFDHFFPKNEYPYLSISLYNLVPSCANCNITKSNKPLSLSNHYHPYFNDFAFKSEFYLKYDPEPSKLVFNEIKKQNLEVIFRPKPKYPDKDELIKKHDELYDITGIYNRHQDVAEDLLTSAILYKSAKKHYQSIEGLFLSNDLFKRYLIGTYSDSESILERPLTKFRQDIARQLGLI